MQAGENVEESATAGQLSNLPWWGGAGQQTSQASSSCSVKPLFAEHPSRVTATVKLPGSVHVHQLQARAVGQNAVEDHPLLATTVQTLHSAYDGGSVDEHKHRPAASSVHAPPAEYLLPHTQLELGHSMACGAYTYADPYFGGIVAAAYGAQAIIHPQMLGVQQARMPLPSEIIEEEPVYVNAKQYHGILRRRKIRAKAELENKLVKARKVCNIGNCLLFTFCLLLQKFLWKLLTLSCSDGNTCRDCLFIDVDSYSYKL
eukprot:c26482_g2_i1 orf=391-1167(-)